MLLMARLGRRAGPGLRGVDGGMGICSQSVVAVGLVAGAETALAILCGASRIKEAGAPVPHVSGGDDVTGGLFPLTVCCVRACASEPSKDGAPTLPADLLGDLR